MVAAIGPNGGNVSGPYVHDNTTVNNNIVVMNGWAVGAGAAIVEYGSVGSNVVYQNNLVYGNTPSDFGLLGGKVPTATVTLVASEFTKLFVNFQANGSGDYHLQAGARALDTGTTTCAAGVVGCAPLLDFDRVSRPRGAAYDIGAYE